MLRWLYRRAGTTARAAVRRLHLASAPGLRESLKVHQGRFRARPRVSTAGSTATVGRSEKRRRARERAEQRTDGGAARRAGDVAGAHSLIRSLLCGASNGASCVAVELTESSELDGPEERRARKKSQQADTFFTAPRGWLRTRGQASSSLSSPLSRCSARPCPPRRARRSIT